MATLSPALSLRANLSAAKLRQDNPNWTEVMIDDYLAIGAGTQQTTDQVNQNTAAISQNAEDIAQNKTDIAQNKADIAQNAADIAQLEQDALDTFTFAAYGGLQLNLPPSAFPDIDATWQTINVFDAVAFSTPRNITQNLTNSSLSVDELGVYEFTLVLAFSHNEDNAGRTTNLRLYNLTDATPAGILIPAFIARNQPGTNFSYSFLFEFSSPSLVNKEVVVQIGGGDTLTTVSFELARLGIKSIGEFRGTL